MVKISKISQYRERLDQTLASHELIDEKLVEAFVKDQLLRSAEYEGEGYVEKVLNKRTMEVLSFLDMLRSASEHAKAVPKVHEKHQNEWKLKQDSEDCRIMYREGYQGSPFHSLLVEGYVDAPIDICLCVSWESVLYKKWWPQYSIPAFKIISSQCSRKVQTGEQISSVRVKLSWPLSDREAIVHYFAFEYLKDDLLIILINSVSELDGIDGIFGGAKDMVVIDIVGGIALQKVTRERSYFRTIMNMDIKLDFVPPSLINFISRQLVGNGFRLYQKAVASVSKGDDDFRKALSDPLYSRIREAIYFNNAQKDKPEDLSNGVSSTLSHDLVGTARDNAEGQVLGVHAATKVLPGTVTNTEPKALIEIEEEENNDDVTLSKDHLREISPAVDQKVTDNYLDGESLSDKKACSEIEVEIDDSQLLEENQIKIHNHISRIEKKSHLDLNQKVFVRPAVKQALETLEKIISLVQNVGINTQTKCPSSVHEEQISATEEVEKCSTSSEETNSLNVRPCNEAANDGIAPNASHGYAVNASEGVDAGALVGLSANASPGAISSTHGFRPMRLNSTSREMHHNRVTPVSPEHNRPAQRVTDQVVSVHGKAGAQNLEETMEGKELFSTEVNDMRKTSPIESKRPKRHRKQTLSCFRFMSKKATS